MVAIDPFGPMVFENFPSLWIVDVPPTHCPPPRIVEVSAAGSMELQDAPSTILGPSVVRAPITNCKPPVGHIIPVGNVDPIVTVPLGLTRNTDVPLELAISNSGAVEVAEPTIESKAKGVVVLIQIGRAHV